MMRLMEAGPALNANVTLSDNYDDAYRSSPAWNEDVIARRPDGELWKSRSWTGEESYILGLAKYMEGPGVERVRYTCERYKLHETTHVDVLSYYAIRNDWDREIREPITPSIESSSFFMEAVRTASSAETSTALRSPTPGISVCCHGSTCIA